jgi:hypothetical protein
MPQPITPPGSGLSQALPATAAPSQAQGGSLLDTLGATAKSTFSNHSLLAALLASAVGSGAIGGVLSARGPKRMGETKAQRTKRIIMNSLGSAAAGAGVVGAGALGVNLLKDAPIPPGAGSKVDNLWRSPLGRGAAALGLGVAGNRGAGLGEAARMHNLVTRAKGQGPNLPKITADQIDSAFNTPGRGAGALDEQKVLMERFKSLSPASQTDKGVANIFRAMGHTPPGESGPGAFVRRNFGPYSGGTTLGNPAGGPIAKLNRRLVGGVGGGLVGAASPEIGSLIMKFLNHAGGQAFQDVMPAN